MTEDGKPYMDGYDWLLNNCGDLDKAEHAAHLDERRREVACSYCESDEGWLPRGLIPPAPTHETARPKP